MKNSRTQKPHDWSTTVKGIHGIHLRISQTLSWGSLQRSMSGALFGLIAWVLALLHMSHSLAFFSPRAQFHTTAYISEQMKRLGACNCDTFDFGTMPEQHFFKVLRINCGSYGVQCKLISFFVLRPIIGEWDILLKQIEDTCFWKQGLFYSTRQELIKHEAWMVKGDQRQITCLQPGGGNLGEWYNKLNVLWLNAFLCLCHHPNSKLSV